jgi:sugar O-acyltransferase (sialic acid O-acetyltransferase NeuD family)
MSRTLGILGAGGHAKVVIATAEAAGFEIGGVFDDQEEKWNQEILGHKIRGPIQSDVTQGLDLAVIAVGTNSIRRELSECLSANWATIVHPAASVHHSVHLGDGTVVFAGVTIQPDTHIGGHCIVNTGATVDHDCRIGDFSHIAPGAHLAGDVQVGAGCLIGIGAAVTPNVTIGDSAALGAGAVAISDIPAGVTAAGVPAIPLKQ